MSTPRPPCRLRGLCARDVPVVVIVRRGPSQWHHIMRLDCDTRKMECGAWFRGGHFMPVALSPRGRYFAYTAMKGAERPWDQFFAISRAPWLTALAAWRLVGPPHASGSFDSENSIRVQAKLESTEPSEGAIGPMKLAAVDDYRQAPAHAVSLGWTEEVGRRLWRARPGHPSCSLVWMQGDGQSRLEIHRSEGAIEVLSPTIVWADWVADGSLVQCTAEGLVRVSSVTADGALQTVDEFDADGFEPDPQPSPLEARQW